MSKGKANKFSKREQVKRVADKLNENDKVISIDKDVTDVEAREAYEAVVDAFIDMLMELEVGEKLTIPRFLTITKDRRKATVGRNPRKPDEEYIIDDYDSLSIRQSQLLKDKIKNNKK